MFKLEEIIKDAINSIRKDFKGSDEEFQARLKENSQQIVTSAAQVFMSGLFGFYESTRIREIQDSYKAFLKRNLDLHEDGFDLYLMFIDLIVSINTDMPKHFKVDEFQEIDRLKFGQLLHLHMKACQVANEIYVLLNAGYPDASLARWRTLHETCVIFTILYESEPRVSRMFYDFQFIEKFKRAKTFQIHHGTLNWKPIDHETITKLETKKGELMNQYGEAFVREYGWTATILPSGQRHFGALEEKAGLSYLRPFYQWANKGVHAGPEGIFNRLGFDDINIPRGYLAGPSRYGMLDPMQFTTYSLLQVTTLLLGLVESLENKLLLRVLELLHEEIANAMIEAKSKLP